MAQPRRTAYGALRPDLVEASQEGLLERPSNVHLRKEIHALVDDHCRTLLRRHIRSATVTVAFRIRDGMLQADIDVSVNQRHRFREDT